MSIVALDFETRAAEPRPDFPPEPVGVALKHQGRPGQYLAWGHPSGNNCGLGFAKSVLRDLWADVKAGNAQIVMHNAKFDLAVACEKLGMEELVPGEFHDTMFLAYLADPHAKKIGLKDLGEEWLGVAPDEQDAVAEYVWENRKALVAEYGGKITRAKTGPHSAGAWLSRCPAGIVEPYAIGDVERTLELFEHLYPLVTENGMRGAYEREKRLLPILMENERDGMRVDVELLEEDVAYYTEVLEYVEAWLRKRLKASGLNFDNDRDVADVFAKRGVVAEEDWVLTGNSKQRSISKDNLPPEKYQDRKVAQAFGYRNRLTTTLKMFMQPWLEQAKQRGGYISTNWNQTHGASGGGTRTGRPSTSRPNLLNIAKSLDGRTDGYEHPDFLDIEPLPRVRRYILPDEGHVFLHRDFSGQEVRVFAHYEQGDLAKAYRENPALDPHSWLKKIILDLTGVERDRTKVKNVTFLRLYGGGKRSVIAQLRVTDKEAGELLASHDKALPGRKVVVDEITRLVRRGEPIRTWGGRIYYAEPPKRIDGRMRSFEYKLINYLVQGSAADITKECLIRWYSHPDRDPRTRFLVTVYDEINITCPEDCWEEQMRVLRECMENIELSVPMRTDGKRGTNWAELEDCA